MAVEKLGIERLDEMLNAVDAFVFTGDRITHDRECAEAFLKWLERWHDEVTDSLNEMKEGEK